MICLADKMYVQGFRVYGVFCDEIRLAKGLAMLVDDIVFGKAVTPRIIILAEALKGGEYESNKVDIHHIYARGIDTNKAWVIYAKPVNPATQDHTKIIAMRSNTGKIVRLKGVPFEDEI